jgi:hypothetical protein
MRTIPQLRIRGLRQRFESCPSADASRENFTTLIQGLAGIMMAMQALASRLPSSVLRILQEAVLAARGLTQVVRVVEHAAFRRPEQEAQTTSCRQETVASECGVLPVGSRLLFVGCSPVPGQRRCQTEVSQRSEPIGVFHVWGAGVRRAWQP